MAFLLRCKGKLAPQENLGPTEKGVKTVYKPGVTHGKTLHQHSLELLMGQLYTSTT